MKTTLLFILLLITGSGDAQKHMTEKSVMKESHIDFSKEIIYFGLSGRIEIDGHTFINDTCKCPIFFVANLDGITIIDTCTKTKYEHRKCNVKGCTIIHLQIPEDKPTLTKPWYTPYLTHPL